MAVTFGKLMSRRRFVRAIGQYLLVLVMVGLGLLSLGTHPALNICDDECSIITFTRPPHSESRMFIEHIIDNVIEPQRDSAPWPLTQEEITQSIRQDTNAYTVNQFLMGYIDDIVNGTFLEVGAGNGEFLSFSSALELMQNWRGLLVEPRQQAYQHCRKRRRAATANACVTGTDYHGKQLVWTPKVDTTLPLQLQQSTLSKAAIIDYVDPADRDDGDVTLVQCYTLESLVVAYLESINATDQPIDLLIVDTNAGELHIMEKLLIPRYRMILAHGSRHGVDISTVTDRLGLQLVSPVTAAFGFSILAHPSMLRDTRTPAAPTP
ncbi:uncharacterized protein LOC108676754 isoform X2 [Hyalella azteca]|uniref:Uncharacterized protein LOC108676754 isoform X2 n=1 Tax=Hyalella azteca TaxID=294128 RepID=A0A8B7P5K8_HYAAZ|nr:uncharacterized protein LOC108676754 isoform X2 [Hyalella azteca]